MHNLAMDVIEKLYLANGMKLGDKERSKYQDEALVKLKLLDYICEISKDCNCILLKQYEHISIMIYECINLLVGWIESDNKRLDKLV